MAKSDFSKGSVAKNIISLAVPMVLAQIITILYNLVDRVYIGHYDNSSLPLTGMGICFPIISMIIAFANLVGVGGAPLFSIKRGEGKTDEAKTIMGNCLSLLLILGVVLTIVGFIIKRPLLYLLGASDETYPFANSYMSIYLIGTMFVIISLGLNAFINAQGFGKIGMMTIALGAGLNIILDPIFIFCLDMGVQGAAIATVISQFVSSVWTFSFLCGKHTVIKIEKSRMKLKWSYVKDIITLGMSGFVMQFTNSAVQITCNTTLAQWGSDTYIGIMTIINSIREILWLPVLGIANASQPIIGFNYGAKMYDRVKSAIRFVVVILIAIGMVAWLCAVIFAKQLLGIFTVDEEILSIGVHCMHIYFFGFFLMALQACGQSTFTALGRSKYAIFFSIFRKIIIVVPLTILLPYCLGIDGVFVAEPISNLVGGSAAFITMYFTVYKKL